MKINHLAALLLSLCLCFLHPPAAESIPQTTSPPAIGWQTLEDLLAKRSFTSQEELFQLLYILHDREKLTAFSLDRETISRLAGRIKTIFPLSECLRIEVRDSRIVFEFSEPQDVVIPHTWRQASLAMPRRLVLQIHDPKTDKPPREPSDPGQKPGTTLEKSISFSVDQGYLQVHFSFLLRFLGGKLRDAEGNRLVYQIDEKKKISRMQLIELTPLKGASLQLAAAPEKKSNDFLWIDIRHPDFPGEHDIGISDTRVSFLGTEVEILDDQMIRFGKEKPQKNPEAWKWFSTNIKCFRDFARTGKFNVGIDYIRNLGYYFEERQIVMNMGFQSSDTTTY
jgi:hypothetical protein